MEPITGKSVAIKLKINCIRSILDQYNRTNGVHSKLETFRFLANGPKEITQAVIHRNRKLLAAFSDKVKIQYYI